MAMATNLLYVYVIILIGVSLSQGTEETGALTFHIAKHHAKEKARGKSYNFNFSFYDSWIPVKDGAFHLETAIQENPTEIRATCDEEVFGTFVSKRLTIKELYMNLVAEGGQRNPGNDSSCDIPILPAVKGRIKLENIVISFIGPLRSSSDKWKRPDGGIAMECQTYVESTEFDELEQQLSHLHESTKIRIAQSLGRHFQTQICDSLCGQHNYPNKIHQLMNYDNLTVSREVFINNNALFLKSHGRNSCTVNVLGSAIYGSDLPHRVEKSTYSDTCPEKETGLTVSANEVYFKTIVNELSHHSNGFTYVMYYL